MNAKAEPTTDARGETPRVDDSARAPILCPARAGSLRPRQRARFLRRRLRRRHEEPQVARDPGKGPANPRQPRPSRRDRRGRDARRRLRRADANPARLLRRRNAPSSASPCRSPAITPSASSSCRATPRRARRSRRSSRRRSPPRASGCSAGATCPSTIRASASASRRSSRCIARLSSARGAHVADEDDFERKLFIVRKVVSNRTYAIGGDEIAEYYPVSMSCRTIVYKGMVLVQSARALLQGSARPALRDRARAGASALRHQHLPVLAARPSLSHGRAQRRDQHAARQRQLDGGAAGERRFRIVRQRHLQAVADLLRGPVRHRLFRQRARIPRARRLFADPCDDDADPGGLGRQSADGRGAAPLLRISRRDDGAVGRPGGDGLHRRAPDRRDARPQRPAPRALFRHRRRPRRARLGNGRAAGARGDASSQKWRLQPGKMLLVDLRGASHRLRRRDQADAFARASLQRMAREDPDRARGPQPGRAARLAHRRLVARSAAGVRLHPGRPRDPDVADGDDGPGSGRLDGHGHADLGAVGQVEAALHLFQAELRAGDQPADRPDPRGARHEPRLVHRAAAEPVRPRRQRAAQAARSAPADPDQRGSREDPLHRPFRGFVRHQDARHHLCRRARRGGHGGGARAHLRARGSGRARPLQHHHPLRPHGRAGPHPDPRAARDRGGASSPDPQGPAHLGRPRRRDRRSARGASFRVSGRLWRRGDQPLSRVRDAGGDGQGSAGEGQRLRGRQALHQVDRQGPAEGDVEDGHLDLSVLLRRADFRRDRAVAAISSTSISSARRRRSKALARRDRGGDGAPPRRRVRRLAGAAHLARGRRRIRLSPARRGA